jgi:hypothetical protein
MQEQCGFSSGFAFHAFWSDNAANFLRKTLSIMKFNSSLAGLTGLCLLTLATSLHASTTNKITLESSPAKAGITVTNEGSDVTGSNAIVYAHTTNAGYYFVNWKEGSKTVSTTNPYTFVVSGNVTLTANFNNLYSISTYSSPANGGTISGGGQIAYGSDASLKATAHSGFVFSNWSSSLNVTDITTATYPKFEVTTNETFVAYFKDVKPPTVTVTNISSGETIGTSAFTIKGTASDNVGVSKVYYNLNGAGWVLASNVNNFAFWYGYVSLTPNSLNILSTYAVDTSKNFSTTNTILFACTAAGFAPLSIAGQLAEPVSGTGDTNDSMVSFDSAVYVKMPASTNDQGEVGTYTYTLTGPNTAEFVPLSVLPKQDSGTNASVLKLTFTNAYTAAYIDSFSNSGTFYFGETEESVPATLDGTVVIVTSLVSSNGILTNSFANATFTEEDNSGGSHFGTYTFTQFTPVAALVVETFTNPPEMVGTTNYTILMFTQGASPAAGVYCYTSLNASGVVGSDLGNFSTFTNGPDNANFLGPVTLSGLQATVTPTGGKAFTRSYGNGTFASISLLETNEPTDVGIVLANPRVTTNTGVTTSMTLAPAYAVGQEDGTVDVTWANTSTKTRFNGTIMAVGSGNTATLSLVAEGKYAPAALSGRTITATPTGGGTASVVAFTNNLFAVTGGVTGKGTYTYVPYTPTTALVTAIVTNGAGAGETNYFVLNYASTNAGNYVYSRTNPVGPGNWLSIPGGFTQKPTK